MIKIEKIEISDFRGAFRGMRNPKESWGESDSIFGMAKYDDMEEYTSDCINLYYPNYMFEKMSMEEEDNLYMSFIHKTTLKQDEDNEIVDFACLGPKDLKLAQTLILAGTDHSKFMRQIFVCIDVTAPLYYWKEYDTYKVATVANSCSTMHTLLNKPITADLFSFDQVLDIEQRVIDNVEDMRHLAVITKDPADWRRLIQYLPSSWNQKRTLTLDYQTLRAIFFARNSHKLVEWHVFCDMIKELPWGRELITLTKEELAGEKFYLNMKKE